MATYGEGEEEIELLRGLDDESPNAVSSASNSVTLSR